MQNTISKKLCSDMRGWWSKKLDSDKKEWEMMKNLRKNKIADYCKALILPIVVYLMFRFMSHGLFGDAHGMMVIARQSVVSVLIAWGICMNMQMKMWDMSAGAVVVLAGILGGRAMLATNTGLIGLVVLTTIISIIISLLIFVVYHYMRVPSIVSAVGMLMIYESLTTLLFHAEGVKIRGNATILARSPYCFMILILYGFLMYVIFNRTSIGYHVRTIGNNQRISTNIGVSVRDTRFKSFLAEGIMLGMAAVLSVSNKGGAASISGMDSMSVSFDALMSVFMGVFLAKYCNLIVGIFLGTISMKMLNAGLISIGLSASLQKVATGVFLILVIGISSNQTRILQFIENRKKAKRIIKNTMNS